MVLVEPGRLSLRQWATSGPQIVARYEQLSSSSDDDDLEVLRLIQDRYRRLPIPKDRRPYLGDEALQHLGLPTTRGVKSPVYVAVYPDRIDVLGSTYREERLVSGDPSLDDLP